MVRALTVEFLRRVAVPTENLKRVWIIVRLDPLIRIPSPRILAPLLRTVVIDVIHAQEICSGLATTGASITIVL